MGRFMPSTSCGFDDSATALGRDLLIQSGPVLTVDIGFDPAFAPGTTPNLALKGAQALVDTGATESCIDAGVAMGLHLPIIDQRVVSGISGHHTVNMHLAHIYVPTLSFTIYGAFAGVDLAAGGQPHAALIGRTFLQHFRMIYDGATGTVVIDGPVQHTPMLPFGAL